ncbi:MAG TPA: FkbM family methyltransferase [Vicinamibacterales bacterium]|nr:FkbM family methyltransferase [Vicinamibacterales bacterium]
MLKRAVISRLQPLVAHRVYTVRHGLARGLQRRGGLGFVPQLGARTEEERFIEGLSLEGETVFDVGGYEGIFTLFFARRVGAGGQVVTFEPNPRNFQKIAENVRLNGFANVKLRQVALGSAPGRATLVFPSDETARGSLEIDIADQIRHEKDVLSIDVEVDTLDHQVATGLPEPDFVKLDVEGLELDVLQGMKGLLDRRHPRLYIEIHGADAARKLANVTAVVDYLWRAHYDVRHVESGTALANPGQLPVAIRGHLYCT